MECAECKWDSCWLITMSLFVAVCFHSKASIINTNVLLQIYILSCCYLVFVYYLSVQSVFSFLKMIQLFLFSSMAELKLLFCILTFC